MILLDGMSHSELHHQLENNRDAIPNLAGLVERGAFLTHGSIVNFPSITWPSHSTILTGAWCGHHDIVNPTFHVREDRETIPIQGNAFETEGWLNLDVETLYEVFKRECGPRSITASIYEPQGRGADHARARAPNRRQQGSPQGAHRGMASDVSPRWAADDKHGLPREEIVDIRGMAQVVVLFEHCGDGRPSSSRTSSPSPTAPATTTVRITRACARRSIAPIARIGELIEMLRARGLLESTLFVVTSDHGMASQRVELKANPAGEPKRAGIQGVFAEPMIYLRDLRVETERTRDLRSLRVTVFDNDQLPDGEHPPIAGARVTLHGRGNAVLAESVTPASGRVAFATPADATDEELTVRIEHSGFNPRALRGTGQSIRIDLRKILYSNSQ